ncbi:glycoside hydrolase family 32 protein [Paenibacillus vini]|uniref:Levanbiose-producing levanase n=1 Tax=Paenibacillus vini TaxID=1476024 RepID=A0ABQ4MBH2_9BACL|nr:levanbiose-producing levanase [Paenibacillus vini]
MIFVGISCLVLLGFLTNEAGKNAKEGAAIPHPEPSYRAAYHFTTPDHWKNDPQKPVYLDGKYHYYYLYNRDYPDGNGTEWRHATSTDLVNWNDEGIAIPKYTNPNGDPWSGSIVVDEANTAGFGKGTVIAIMTQPSGNGGKQEQYLWYSTNRGKTFKPYGNGPVLANPGVKDYRDPKIVWDQAAHKWVMALAEGTKVGFYESGNLKEWHYTSSFVTENIGIVECPDLYMMRADDGSMKWILGASANGKSSGQPNTYAYWIGDFDGKKFSTDQQEPQWLDYGFDWYGAVTFEEGGSRDKYDHRYAMAWMNNWDYPHNTPTLKEGFNGTDSMVRQIKLTRSADHKYRLVSQPVDALQQRVGSIDSIEQIQVNGHKTLDFTGETYQLDADISWSEIKNVGFRLRESADRTRHVDVGLFVQGQYSYVNRASTGQPDQSGKYLESKAPFNASNKKVHHLKILVDRTSIEVFVDEGEIAFSNLIFPDSHDKGITLYTEGGTAAFNNVVIKHFK